MNALPVDLEPIANHVLFQFHDFVDRSRRSSFKSTTDWGFEMLPQIDDSTNTPRWVTIIGLGPDVSEDLHVGQTVLVEPLKWTRIVEYNGVEFARTDDKNIIAVSEDD